MIWTPRRGFSLIELLVVIAIVALLIALVVPALSKARRSAHMAVSSSNMRQLASGVAAYTAEFQGSMVNPFDPVLTKWFPGTGENCVRWCDVIKPVFSNTDVAWADIQAWPFRDNPYASEMFATQWASLMTAYLSDDALSSAAICSPADTAAVQRLRTKLATIQDRSEELFDGSYYYPPTFWLKAERYRLATSIPVDSHDASLWRRNRIHDIAAPQAKVLMFERFDFSQETRVSGGVGNARVKGFPNWNNANATARFALTDGSVGSVKVKEINALASSSDLAVRNTFTPSGVWNLPQTVLGAYDLANDGLENGTNGTVVGLSHFWATRNGVKGRDLNR